VKTDDFNFELPEALIAQHPTGVRGASRLLVLDRNNDSRSHSSVASLADFIEPGTLMVFNDSKVRKARLIGRAEDTGAEVEFLLLGPASPVDGTNSGPFLRGMSGGTGTGAGTGRFWRALCAKTRRQRKDRTYVFPGGVKGRIAAEVDDERIVEFDPPADESYLERYGHIPLPPYIKRNDEAEDAERYQTIYAKTVGSAACPTAGLHFTEELLASLDARGIRRTTVTLHVGLGTFLPVRTEIVEQHRMHEEWYTVSSETAALVNEAKREGRPVLAVGTTSLRTLESAWVDASADPGLSPGIQPGTAIRPGTGSTSIFIYPGYRFRAVDKLFTNFHTPKSTLLMLVSAFAGKEKILDAYAEAVRLGYRFFSYGDAMLIR